MEKQRGGDFFDADYFDGRARGLPAIGRDVLYPIMQRTACWLAHKLSPRRVLDVGCAKGYQIEAFAEAGCSAFGCDISHYAAATATGAARGRIALADGNVGLPFASASFDLIVSLDLFEHLPDPMPLLVEMRRLLAPDGRIYLKICHPHHPNARLDPTHINLQPLPFWLEKIAAAGFVAIRIYEADLTVRHGLRGWLASCYWRLMEHFSLGQRPPDFKLLLTPIAEVRR